jgi:Na+-translocating ferredoxin:NAD+ oxidoreductase subunit B
MMGLTAALGTLLVLAHRLLHVPEDRRIAQVEEMLPHANCGACGHPGCRPFAEALVRGDAIPAQCTVSSERGRLRIANFLGVSVGSQIKRVARLACAGGSNVARNRASYSGPKSCAAAALVGGGGKGCSWGCLGAGDCAVACHFDAIHMDQHDLPIVDEELCTACGDCVTACPRDLFSLREAAQSLFVRCKSQLMGDAATEHCEVGCNACGRCAMDAPEIITMRNNLPVINNSPLARGPLGRGAIARCPTGAIVWFQGNAPPLTGEAAHTIVRQDPRSPAAT